MSAPPAPHIPLPPIQITPAGRPLIDLFPSEALEGFLSEVPQELASDRVPSPRVDFTASLRRSGARAARKPPDPPPTDTESSNTFYGLTEKAFTLSTDPKFIYHSVAHDRTAQELLSAIRRRDAVVVITGEPGVGKTMLCRAVMEELDRRTLTSFVGDPSVSPEALLKTVLLDFGVIARDDLDVGRLAEASRASLMTALRDFLVSLVALEAFAVVLIDDAQSLSLELLEQLRLLSDLQEDPRLLQIVLIGEPALTRHLRRPELRALSQRIAVRGELGTLEQDELLGYIRHRLQVAGTHPRVDFDDVALEALYAISRGVPRIVNLVCDRAMVLGYQASASTIDAGLVQRAAADRDLAMPPPGRRLREALAMVAAFAVLVLFGAGTAAWIFRAPLARLVVKWEHAPALPPGPAPQLAPPIKPLPIPRSQADDDNHLNLPSV